MLVCFAALAAAQPAPDVPNYVRDLFRSAAEAMVNQDAAGFLSSFDPKMPGFDTLRAEIESLLDHAEVTSAIEFVTDQGDDSKRELQVDWVLEIPGEKPRRQVLKCRIERQGRKWKIVMLDPVEFFHP
jgi:hypothetical protein